ncbi:transcription regulator gal80 [Mycoblastus sanguinarius]|nr:transcription regulator gal80 [Mycoblastus sanguinarius]
MLTTRVDVQHETIKPSLMKGKNVYCEWPLASDLKEAEELDALAKEKNVRTIIGLQGELSPIVLKAKSLIEQDNR